MSYVRQDLTGKKFGRLVVIEFAGVCGNGTAKWLCECECGRRTTPTGHALRSGKTVSCGCYSREKLATSNLQHGNSNKRIYSIWRMMLQRCERIEHKYYAYYGGRGISVCNEWHDFETFEKWAYANGYKERLTLDRVNNDGNYCPENCRWATQKEQANNRSNSRRISYNGETHNIEEWADILGINKSTLASRYWRGDRGEKLLRELR